MGSGAFFVGALLLIGLSLIHPPTFDPRDVDHALHEIVEMPAWSLIHWGLAVSVMLLGVGFLCFHRFLVSEGSGARIRYSPVALGVALLGVALLLVAITQEAAGGAFLGSAYVLGAGDPAVIAVLGALWAGYLALAYVAAFLVSMAIVLWGLDLVDAPGWPPWFAGLSVLGGLAMAAAQPLAWIWPDEALYFLFPGAAALSAWLLAAAWRLRPE